MAYLFTLISFVVSFLILMVSYYFGFEATQFGLFFVIPVGAIIAGYVAGFGFFPGLKKQNKKFLPRHTLILFVLSILFFGAIQYGYYQMTYIDVNNNINHQFKGEHISNYVFVSNNEPVHFTNYFVNKINSETITFTRKIVQELGTVEGNKAVNWIFFAIDFLGFFFGMYIVTGSGSMASVFCEKCSIYKNRKSLMRFNLNPKDGYTAFLTALDNQDIDKIKETILNNPVDAKPFSESYIDCELHICKECKEGHLIAKLYVKNEKGKYVHNNKFVQNIVIPSNIVYSMSSNKEMVYSN